MYEFGFDSTSEFVFIQDFGGVEKTFCHHSISTRTIDYWTFRTNSIANKGRIRIPSLVLKDCRLVSDAEFLQPAAERPSKGP